MTETLEHVELFISDNDMLIMFGTITMMVALCIIIIELINFIPDLMVNILNRMKNSSLDHEGDSLNAPLLVNSLETNLDLKGTLEKDFKLDEKASLLEENKLFKRFTR